MELSEMSHLEITETVNNSIEIIDDFLKSARKLGYIEAIANSSDTIHPGINEEQYEAVQKFRSVKEFIDHKLNSSIRA